MKINLAVFLFLAISIHAAPQIINLESCESSVTFKAIGIPVMHVAGDFGSEKSQSLSGSLRVTETSVEGEASVDMNSCRTSVEKQTAMIKRSYFETQKWPGSKLVLEKIALPDGFWKKTGTPTLIPFKGVLTFKGTERPVNGSARLLVDSDQTLKMDFDFPIKMSRHGLASIRFLNINFEDYVQVSVHIKAGLKEKVE